MILKTKNYEMFIFREDNREKIERNHVEKIRKSIQARNMLEFRPILVNEKMEVMDGQHRLLAAKALGVDIYYQVEKSLTHHDIIILNNSKPWGINDYMNFYIKNDYEEYKKLAEFVKLKKITLRIALTLTSGDSHEAKRKFREGEYKFNNELFEDDYEVCWLTIQHIKKSLGYTNFTESAKFWKALLFVVRHDRFNNEKWFSNLKMKIEALGARAEFKDYVKLFQNVYNWHNQDKINFLGTVKDDEI